jgi:hypothetical protein
MKRYLLASLGLFLTFPAYAQSTFYANSATGNVGIGSSSPIVSLDLTQKTDALALPIGTSGTRPTGAAIVNGELRYNSGLAQIEAYTGGTWSTLLNSSGVGTITSGIWQGGTIAVPYGGTGLPMWTANVIYKGNGTNALLASGLTDNGTIVSSSESLDATSNGFVTEIANAGTTGTTANKLAKINASGTAVITATTDTDGVAGIVIGGAGTTGNAQIAFGGQASCVFDNATTAGDFVGISTTTSGACHDVGTARSTTGQTIGKVLASGAAGTYAVALGLNASASASLPVATTSVLGGVKTDGATITNTSGTISCTTGTTAQLGCLKPDGTTITVSGGTGRLCGECCYRHNDNDGRYERLCAVR